ncbi:MAG: hypothetical protein NT076_01285 [Candidatus Pacearchaeota archaeon]|nr:hypothetical protein [Candidatus Pacearchaeota archaeon]
MYKEGEDSWVRWIKKRIANNLNFICLFQGATGIGKTWSAMSMSEMIDNEFNVNQIVFDFKELMSVINSDWFKQKKWKIIIFDEPQITISNRNWQSINNKLMNYLLSTFRHQNIILIFCSPYVDFLDSQSMKLLHCVFECVGVNKKTKLSRVRPKIQQYNSYMKKMYQHPLYVIRGKKTIALRDWFIPKPSNELIEQYELKKTGFTSSLNREIMIKLDKLNEDKQEETTQDNKPKPIDTRKPLTDKQEQVMKLLANHQAQEVAKILSVSNAVVSNHKKASYKKGYTIKEFRQNEQ